MRKLKIMIYVIAIVMCLNNITLNTKAASPKLNKSKISLYVGNSTTLKIKKAKAKITWKTSNKKIATVSKSGKVTAKKKGKATITAKINSKTYKCKVTVKNPYLNNTRLTLIVGATHTLKITGSKAKSWKSSNTSIATVSKKGVITAKKAGNVTITCRAKNKKSYKCNLTVQAKSTDEQTPSQPHEPTQPSTPDEPTTPNEPVTPDSPTTPDSSELKLVLTAPEKAMVNVPIEISLESTNCFYTEWYINDDYFPELTNQINPEGTLQFSESKFYTITVYGYSKDLTQHVSDTKIIQVYKDLSQTIGNSKEHDRAMYSWNHDFISEENEALLQSVMERMECNILYQEVAPDADKNEVAAFLQRRGEKNQTVYYLCGKASWSYEKDAESMLNQVSYAVAYNEAAGEHKFVGIQFDVEPYCLLDFDEKADEYMAQYVENCKRAYEVAHKNGLLMELCIPYWWDSSEYYDELEDLIANACDSVAVMNYYKKQKEAYHLETELELCKKYNKRIINITEMIKPGLHNLTEDNTYHNDGINAVENMWNNLDGYFQYEQLGYAYHYLDVIIELLEKEETNN